MKYINRLLTVALLLIVVSGCDNTDLDLQVDPNSVSPDQASVNDLFNNIQLTFSNTYRNLENFPGGITRMYQIVSYTYENSTSPTTFTGLWFNAYSELFPDIDALQSLAEDRGLDVHSGILKIMKAYVLMGLVDMFGNVPLTEAGQGTDIISPAADSGDQIYARALTMLDEAITSLENTAAAGPPSDIFYGGSKTKWATLAKTLKLRAALTTRLVDGNAASTINSLIAGGDLIDEASEDFQFSFGSQRNNPNSRHPFYNNHYEVGDGDYLSNYYMWLLKGDKETSDGITIIDPRIRYYFYRKIEKSAEQDPTTYSCHFSTLPDPNAKPAHWLTIDPRLPYCIATLDGYSGRDHLNGEGIPPDGPTRTSYGLYPGAGQFDDNTFTDTRKSGTTGGLGKGIYPILLSSFVDFMRAEAAITLGTSDDARAMLESGMRKSIAKVKSFGSLVPSTLSRTVTTRDGTATVQDLYVPTADDIDAYVDFVLAEYDAASEDKKLDIIIKEYFIALWGNGYEAYNMYRRTGKPDNMQPALEASFGNFTRSFYLPDVHVNRNANATQKEITDRVFWDNGSADLY